MSEPARAEALARSPYPVSRETEERLSIIVQLLRRWQPRINLISSSTLADVWERHVLDSLQLVALRPEAKDWVDLGSGGGFPGLVIAAVLAERSGASIRLIESNAKKASFLVAATREAALSAIVLCERIERVVPDLASTEVVTARALAPLADLLVMSRPLLKTGAIGLYPKGRSWAEELTQAGKSWIVSTRAHPSLVEPNARILEILSAEERDA